MIIDPVTMAEKSLNSFPQQEYFGQPSPSGGDPYASPARSVYADGPPAYEHIAHGASPSSGQWEGGPRPADYHYGGPSSRHLHPGYPPAQNTNSRSPSRTPSPHPPRPAPHDRRAPSPSSPGFSLSSITKLFAGPSNPLDPPPPCFSRPLPRAVVYEPFPVMTTFGLGKEIGDGFTQLPPPSAVQPHPFATHDVQEADWLRFLGDVKKAGELTTGENITSAVLPMTMHLGLTGMLVSRAIKNGQIRRKQEPTGKLIDVWNHYFFHPRRMEVVLAKGDMRISGNTETAVPSPDARRGHVSSDDSSSSSDEDPSTRSGRRGDKKERRARRRERKERKKHERDEERAARRAKKRQRKANKKEVYRLIVVPV